MPDANISFTQNIPESLRSDPDKARAVDAVFVFRVLGEQGGTWTLNLKDEPAVVEGAREDADCTIELTNEVWRQLTERPATAMQLFLEGKLKVTGNALLAM